MKFIIFIALYCLCAAQCASWTPEETQVIRTKLERVFEMPGPVVKEYKKSHPEASYLSSTIPRSASKFLRLGFHDCLSYKDGVAEGEANGCDGCLNPKEMGLNLFDHFNISSSNQYSAPDITETTNNGLMFTADILEEIYTNPDFPKFTPKLPVSMKESGKSRADLWAFATLLAANYGVENNNFLCQGIDRPGMNCGHLGKDQPECNIEWPRKLVFKTGRKDCVADPDAPRPYFSSKAENQPNPHGNGPTTIKFFEDTYNMDAREAIALTGGAHSFGRFNQDTSLFRYFWTFNQHQILNNQVFKSYASRPSYFSDCVNGQFLVVGDEYGNMANTTWKVSKRRASVGGGPYQWFRQYMRCPSNNECGAIDRVEPQPNPACCENLQEGQFCNPECVQWIQRTETATSAEVGFYFKFDVEGDSGKPLGCTGFNDPKWISGKRGSVFAQCDMEDFAPQGTPLHQIVDEFADDQQAWFEVFVPTLEKMVSNGYDSLDEDGYEI